MLIVSSKSLGYIKQIYIVVEFVPLHISSHSSKEFKRKWYTRQLQHKRNEVIKELMRFLFVNSKFKLIFILLVCMTE